MTLNQTMNDLNNRNNNRILTNSNNSETMTTNPTQSDLPKKRPVRINLDDLTHLDQFDLPDDPAQDEFEDFEAMFDPLRSDRKARRKRKPAASHKAKVSQHELLEMMTEETEGLEGGFKTTYHPSRHEAEWLLDSLRNFYDRDMIRDVLSVVKGGKEASVYRCVGGGAANGHEIVAAKVYRPHKFRQMRNDSVYREGRAIFDHEGKLIKDDRSVRAVGKKTGYGRQVAHSSWLSFEYTTLQKLHAVGANVPEPISSSENCILMEFIGDAENAAPWLHDVELEPEERQPLFDIIMHNVELLLKHNLVHGDLSAYNILYWDGEIYLIDFPQVSDCEANRNAYQLLKRDIERICQYFEGQGLYRDPERIVKRMWKRFEVDPEQLAADLSRETMKDED